MLENMVTEDWLDSWIKFRNDLSALGYRNRCFLVALCHLIVRRLNLEVATKRMPHQQVKIPRLLGSFSTMFMHGSASLQLFLVVQIFLRTLGVIYNRWVLSEGHIKLIQGLVSHELTAYLLFLTKLNSINYGHIIKSM